MFAATTPAFRGFFCRPSGRRTSRQKRSGRNAQPLVSVRGCADDSLSGSWFVIAGYACRAGSGAGIRGRRLIVERSEARSLWSRVIDRFAGRDGYRVLWRDEQQGHAVIARRNSRQLWILSRSPDMPMRELFERVAELRDRGYDTRHFRYWHAG